VKIAVVGTGYVGLVTGTCLAETGNDVTCVDCDQEKVDLLRQGEIPIYEPGLAELVNRNAAAGHLRFTTDLAAAAGAVRLLFLAVGTPSADDGSVDLSALWAVVDQVAPLLAEDAIVVLKSTVPVGTNAAVAERLSELTGRRCDVASNPEFLKEGAAIDDFMKPDRVVVGARRAVVAEVLADLYRPYLRTDKPLLVMSPESAEMTKYVANALLATKISFINEMANLCERTGADIDEVRRGIGHDRRIGFSFLFPGVGYGGSCFPKDVCGLAAVARAHGLKPRILDAVHEVNLQQKSVLAEKIERHFGIQRSAFSTEHSPLTIAVWGLAFKPGTDDIREAPALVLIDRLLQHGATLRVHDPVAMPNVRREYGGRLVYCRRCEDALQDADALAIMTEWKHFVHPDLEQMYRLMRRPVIFDGRNLYDPKRMKQAGFTYYSIGRPPVQAKLSETTLPAMEVVGG
jgi:UDPglucose 6-dehydrogenase